MYIGVDSRPLIGRRRHLSKFGGRLIDRLLHLGQLKTPCTGLAQSSTSCLPTPTMAPSASKQKRLAEKAAKQAAKGKGAPDASSTTTPTGSATGSATNTPLTSLSAATSQEDLSSMKKLQIATDRSVHYSGALSRNVLIFYVLFSKFRSAAGVLVSDTKG